MRNLKGDKAATVLMPTALTAENGAKKLLIGEFFESIIEPDEDYDCIDCDGGESSAVAVPTQFLPETTID